MEHEEILNSIEKLYQKLKDTHYEVDVLEHRREVELIIDDAVTQAKADAAHDEWLNGE